MSSNIIFKNNFEIFIFTFLIVISVASIVFLGIERYNIAVIVFLIPFLMIFIIQPIYNIYLLVFISLAIEGKWVEEFILFRFGFNWYLYDLIFLLLFLSLFWRMIYGEYNILTINKYSLALITFFVALGFASYIGLNNGASIQEIFHDIRGFFYYIIFIPIAFLIKDKKQIRNIIYFIITVGAVKSFVDINLSLFVYPKTLDPNTYEYLTFARLSGYHEIVYPLTLVMSFTMFLLSRKHHEKFILIIPIIISALALFLSYTRGSWFSAFGTIVITIVLFSFSNRVKVSFKHIILGFFALIGVVFFLDLTGLFAFDVFFSRLTSLSISNIDISNLGRLVEWATALEAYAESPIWGTGLGFMFNYFAPGIGYLNTTFVHNTYLYVLTKMGILGLLPFLLIIYFSIKTAIRVLQNGKTEEIEILLPFTVALILFSIKSLTTWHLNNWCISYFIGIIFGVHYYFYNKWIEFANR